jgi:Transcriptional regulator
VIWDQDDSTGHASSHGNGDGAGYGRLLGHIALANRQWETAQPGVPALAIVHGPDGYVSPTWYATKREHGRVVPTWNYTTLHVYGRLVAHDDVEWLRALVTRLTDHHEATLAEPWHVTDAPDRYIEGQLRAIVGMEFVITRVEAKAKLSQNRSTEDRTGVVAGLEEVGTPPALALADQMRPGLSVD